MELLAMLVVLVALVIGVILGLALQNPVLAERQRAVRQQLRRAKAMVADAQVKMQIADGQLRLVQAVRRQTDEMLDFASRAPQLGPPAVAWERSPIFEGMTGWLTATGEMPVLEPEPVAEVEAPKGARHQLAKRQKLSVKAMPEAPAQLIEAAS